MISFEHTEVVGFEPAIRGMRNPKNSWDRSDSEYAMGEFIIGANDEKLCKTLLSGGPVHSKFMRFIVCYTDINAPQYWWSEYDTYKVGTVANSCSKMHKLLAKPFEISDFSFDKLHDTEFMRVARPLVIILNELRDEYFKLEDEDEKKRIWYEILQILPISYNQKRTVMMSYEALRNMYRWRYNHKLDEWREFCEWVENLPNSWLITYGIKKEQ